jgi:hypothetical protein
MTGRETREIERKIAAMAKTSIDVISKAIHGIVGIGELRSSSSLWGITYW